MHHPQKVADTSLDLLTQLFNGHQALARVESELQIVKENKRAVKAELERIYSEINEQVPRLHAAAKEQNLLHKGLEELPPLDTWRADMNKDGGPNGAP